MPRLGQAVAEKLLSDNRSGLLQCLLIVSLGEFRRSPEIHLLLCCCSPSQSPECVNGFSAADERSSRDKRGTRALFSMALHVWLVFSGYHLALMLWHCAGGGFGWAGTKQHQLGKLWVLQCLLHFLGSWSRTGSCGCRVSMDSKSGSPLTLLQWLIPLPANLQKNAHRGPERRDFAKIQNAFDVLKEWKTLQAKSVDISYLSCQKWLVKSSEMKSMLYIWTVQAFLELILTSSGTLHAHGRCLLWQM